MPQERELEPHTLGLSTKVEEDFVAPLTSLRSALEILRDFPDLPKDEREQFLGTALSGCARLEQSVEHLSKAVYAAGEKARQGAAAALPPGLDTGYSDRVKVHAETDIIEIDFSEFEFSSSEVVDNFYDVIEAIVDRTGRDWYFVVNYSDCSVWPEAWVAFAHRGKRVNVTHSLGTVRYDERKAADGDHPTDSQSFSYDPDLFGSREAALSRIEELKSEKSM